MPTYRSETRFTAPLVGAAAILAGSLSLLLAAGPAIAADLALAPDRSAVHAAPITNLPSAVSPKGAYAS